MGRARTGGVQGGGVGGLKHACKQKGSVQTKVVLVARL